jgi:hypothetical protein
MLRTLSLLFAACLLAVGQAQAEPPADARPEIKRPLQAKPVQKPQAASDREKLGATGYGDDPGEETQERPNPVDFKPVQRGKPSKPMAPATP